MHGVAEYVPMCLSTYSTHHEFHRTWRFTADGSLTDYLCPTQISFSDLEDIRQAFDMRSHECAPWVFYRFNLL